MMNYDTRKTLTENRDILNEQQQYPPFPIKVNPGAFASGIAQEIANNAVKTFGTNVSKIYEAIQKIKNVQTYYDVNSLISKYTGGQYKNIANLINGEFEGDNLPYISKIAYYFKQIPGLGSTYSVDDRYKNQFKVGSFTVTGVPNDPRLKSVVGGGGNKDNTKPNNPTLTGNTTTPKAAKKVMTPTPAELKDSAGIIKFQDWLDTNKPGWATGFPEGKLNKGSGYGKFGPRTSKAWTAYGKEYLNSSKAPVDTSKISAPAVQTYTTADQTKNTPAQDTLPMGVSGPANQVAQPTTTTTETLPAGVSGPANQVTKQNNTFNTSSATNPNKDKELKLS
jgi:hypothetical protein